VGFVLEKFYLSKKMIKGFVDQLSITRAKALVTSYSWKGLRSQGNEGHTKSLWSLVDIHHQLHCLEAPRNLQRTSISPEDHRFVKFNHFVEHPAHSIVVNSPKVRRSAYPTFGLMHTYPICKTICYHILGF